jgi:hypothetical protein
LVTEVWIRLSAAMLVHDCTRAPRVGSEGLRHGGAGHSVHGLVGCIAGQWGFHACSRVGRDRLQQKGLGKGRLGRLGLPAARGS